MLNESYKKVNGKWVVNESEDFVSKYKLVKIVDIVDTQYSIYVNKIFKDTVEDFDSQVKAHLEKLYNSADEKGKQFIDREPTKISPTLYAAGIGEEVVRLFVLSGDPNYRASEKEWPDIFVDQIAHKLG